MKHSFFRLTIFCASFLILALICSSLYFNKIFNIHDAATHGNLRLIKLAVWFNPNLIQRTNVYGQTPLHIAANLGWPEEAEFLLSKGDDVNAKSKNGTTPLLCALYGNNQQMAELLLAHGAEVNITNTEGESPLLRAARNANTELAQVLLSWKANINVRDQNGRTPLHIAAQYGYRDLAELLINNNADVNAKDTNGFTPLYLAEIRKPRSFHDPIFVQQEENQIKNLIDFIRQHGGKE